MLHICFWPGQVPRESPPSRIWCGSAVWVWVSEGVDGVIPQESGPEIMKVQHASGVGLGGSDGCTPTD